jgi:hypothetical protein
MAYTVKLIETPYLIRQITYNKPVPQVSKQRDTYAKDITGTKQDISIRRTKDRLALTIQCNVKKYSKFITFTTRELITRTEFLKRWNNFTKYFYREYGYRIKYSAVMETQKRGAWHIHCMAYNLTHKLDIKRLCELWQPKHTDYNSVDVKVIDSHLNAFKYVIKYLTKEEVQINKKAVLNSHKLEQPTIIETDRIDLSSINGVPDFVKSWSVYHGNIDADKLDGGLKDYRMNSATMIEWHRLKVRSERIVKTDVSVHSAPSL